jgi:ABC-type transport system involved in multi-copper enzyme maturation permease subunit
MAFSLQIVQLVMLEAVRSKLAWIGLLMAALALGLAQFLASIALIESDQVRLAVVAAMLRASAIFLVVAFAATSTMREANDRVSDLLLSLAVARWQVYLSKLVAHSLVAVAIATAFAAPMLLLAPTPSTLLWAASLACESVVMAGVALFCALSLTQLLAALSACAGFYLLSRSVDTLSALAQSPLTGDGSWIDTTVRSSVEAVALVMPDLDRFTQSHWLYLGGPTASELGYIILQTATYVALVGAASMFDLYRRDY